ncbi:MAG: sigma-70 family RNA polymerase sigma factor [Ilumatobacteraceae bacterium]
MLVRAQGGDADAFSALVAAHRSSALRVATVVLGGAVGADDVVQDATTRAWRAIATVHGEGGFRPWFLRIVANAARNDRRSHRRRAAMAVRAAGQRASEPIDPQDAAIGDEERRAVIAAMNRLSRDDRLVIALRHFEQLSEAEMADVLGCPAGTVKSRLSRAMVRLRRGLDPHPFGERGQ